MGQAKRKQRTREQILSENPLCIYCRKPATTTDHCPPRSFFYGRNWPETYEFASCESCNAAARFDEQALAFLVRMRFADESNPTNRAEIEKLVDGLRNNQRELIKEWRTELPARSFLGKTPRSPVGWKTINLGPLTHAIFGRFLIKLTKALYFQHNKQIFDGVIYTHVVDMLSPHSTPEYFSTILKIAPLMPMLTRNKQQLYSQFSYKFNHSIEHRTLYAVVQFSEQLIFQILAISQEMETALLKSIPDMEAVMGNRHSCANEIEDM